MDDFWTFDKGLTLLWGRWTVHQILLRRDTAGLLNYFIRNWNTLFPFFHPQYYLASAEVMERLKLVLQYFQSNSESISNGICIILALVSVKIYTSFDFNCPCLPQYNKLYSLGVMIVPPIILFFLGVLVNRHTGVMMDEWMRPTGNRSKNPAVVKWVKDFFSHRSKDTSNQNKYTILYLVVWLTFWLSVSESSGFSNSVLNLQR